MEINNSIKSNLESFHNPLVAALFDILHEAVVIVDLDMRVVLANRLARELFDFPNTQYPRLIEITRNNTIYNFFSQALQRAQKIDERIELQSRFGERSIDLRIESIISQQADESDLVIGAAGAFYDKTKLEALEKTRREFFANLSHELRTPLTSIQTYTETLLSGALHDNQNNVKFLQTIAKNAARMQNLAKDISDLAAIESGKLSLKLEKLKLSDLANEIVALLKDALVAKKVTVEIAIDPELTIIADNKALEQIIFNLVQNAITFNNENGTIKIEAFAAQNHWEIIVRDTGIGIEGKHLKRIFERLYRVDESRSRKEGGTGLGLAIVKHLVQAHNGAISVTSQPKHGTVFTLKFPMRKLSL